MPTQPDGPEQEIWAALAREDTRLPDPGPEEDLPPMEPVSEILLLQDRIAQLEARL